VKAAFSGALSSSKLRTLGIACQYSGRQVATRAGVILFPFDALDVFLRRNLRSGAAFGSRPRVLQALADTRVVFISGARQVGKSTLGRGIVNGLPAAEEFRLDRREGRPARSS
jgi:hypothetical protein